MSPLIFSSFSVDLVFLSPVLLALAALARPLPVERPPPPLFSFYVTPPLLVAALLLPPGPPQIFLSIPLPFSYFPAGKGWGLRKKGTARSKPDGRRSPQQETGVECNHSRERLVLFQIRGHLLLLLSETDRLFFRHTLIQLELYTMR